MVDLLGALHLGRLVREVTVDGERKVERPSLVHPYPEAVSKPSGKWGAGK